MTSREGWHEYVLIWIWWKWTFLSDPTQYSISLGINSKVQSRVLHFWHYGVTEVGTHFLKNVTLSFPTGGMLVRSACHWLTHNFQNHSLPVIGWPSLLLILFSHQPRPAAAVHWTCSVGTCVVRSSGTNYPSLFVPKLKSVDGRGTNSARRKFFWQTK